jgi:hypothetical protein
MVNHEWLDSIRVDVMAENWPLFKVFGISKTRSHNKKNKDIGTIKYGLLVLWWGPVGPANYDTTKRAELAVPDQNKGMALSRGSRFLRGLIVIQNGTLEYIIL